MSEDNDWFDDSDGGQDEGLAATPAPRKTGGYDFDLEAEEDVNPVYVVTIAGNKGEGKTMSALSFIRNDKTMVAIQFDDKVAPIKKYFFKNTDRVTIYNGKKHFNTDPDLITEAGFKSIKYIEYILEEWSLRNDDERPDFVLIDGLEILSMIAEMAMRYNNKLKPFAGIKNKNIWKERRGYLKSIHNFATKAAKAGVIYTVYMSQVDTQIVEGEVQSRHTEPKYVDAIKYETDIVLKAFAGEKDGKPLYGVEVISSKIPDVLVSGKRYNVTDKPLMIALGGGKAPEAPRQKPPKKKAEKKKPEPEPEPEPNPKPKTKAKKDRETAKAERAEREDSQTLTNPGDDPEHEKMLTELAAQQKELDEENAKVNQQLVEKTLNEGKQVILESMQDDFQGKAVPVKKLREAVLDTEIITEKAFKLSLDALLDEDEVWEPRLGYIQLMSEVDEPDTEAVEAADETPVDEPEEPPAKEPEPEPEPEQEEESGDEGDEDFETW